MTVLTSLDSAVGNKTLDFYLFNKNTKTKIKLSAVKVQSTQATSLQAATSSDVLYSVQLPEGTDLKDTMLLTSVAGNVNSSTYYNSRSIWDFIYYDYISDPLAGLQYVGLIFTILISVYAIVSKQKGHFLAEQANTIILHMLNFIQVVYLFKFTRLHTEGMYHFLNGFGFMHFLMFPNFFYGTIPPNYVEYPAEKSLIPDGNFLRSAGSSISLLIIALAIMTIASIISFAVYKGNDLEEMPQIRKITRFGILVIHITFLNILFSAFSYLIQPSMSTVPSFVVSSRIAAGVMIGIVLLFCIGIFIHFYKTYNSDVL